jgi:hypothetical protein
MARFDTRWLERLPNIPRGLADELYAGGQERLVERGQAELVPVWYWTNQLGAALSETAGERERIPFTTRIAAGFIEELDGAFGVIVYTASPGSGESSPTESAKFDSHRKPDNPDVESLPDGPAGFAQVPRPITVGGYEFPIVVRDVIVERHWCTAPELTAPSAARATCWVRSSVGNYEGWLLPRHAVDPKVGAPVAFSDGGFGQVVREFGECIDAVVATSTVAPSGGSWTRACWPVVAGQPLRVTDAPGSHKPVHVVDADLNLGVLADLVFPLRFSTDWVGQPGHSGALLLEPTRGEPAGSYLGELNPSNTRYVPPGGTVMPSATGYAQSCHQLELIDRMEYVL